MSKDMFGPLSGTPVGTSPSRSTTQSDPVIHQGVTDIRGFLVWLRSQCPKGITAQMKGESLMVVPEMADDFRAAVSALRTLDAS